MRCGGRCSQVVRRSSRGRGPSSRPRRKRLKFTLRGEGEGQGGGLLERAFPRTPIPTFPLGGGRRTSCSPAAPPRAPLYPLRESGSIRSASPALSARACAAACCLRMSSRCLVRFPLPHSGRAKVGSTFGTMKRPTPIPTDGNEGARAAASLPLAGGGSGWGSTFASVNVPTLAPGGSNARRIGSR